MAAIEYQSREPAKAADRRFPAIPAATLGIIAFVASVTIGSTHSGLSKLLTLSLGAFMIVWGRYTAYLVVILPITIVRHGARSLLPPEPGLHLLRGILMLSASITYVLALKGMPLADASAIAYVYPFIATALSPVFLGERVSFANWCAVIAGFIGVIVVVRPTFENVDLHALLALEAGACFAISMLLTRTMATSVPPLVMTTTTALTGTILMSCALPWIWQDLDTQTILLLAAIGALSTGSQSLQTYACTKTPMPTLAPFGYTEIVAATALGLLLFGDFPDAVTWTGITIIMTSGVFIALSGRQKRSTTATPVSSVQLDEDATQSQSGAILPGLRIY